MNLCQNIRNDGYRQSIKVLVHGCNGHMGRVIVGIVDEDEHMEVACGVDPFDRGENPFPVFASISECDVDADVIIDFSNAAAVDGLLDYAQEKKIPVVLCTTGLTEEQILKAKKASETVAILRSANMSLGINTLMDLLKKATAVFADAGFDVEIVEKHHNQKLDAPSGTAIALADSVNSVLNGEYEYVYDRSGVRKKREKKEIGISAVRGGNIVGEHEVIFAGTDEVITFKHTAYSKSVFGKGAVEAARFLSSQPAGYYDMSDVIAAK